MKKEWIVNKAKSGKVPKTIVERLLYSRGVTDEKEIKEFLNPLEISLTPPSAFLDMSKAVNRIEQAINSEENILIYGDFDADGVTSTALLYRTLTHAGAKVDCFIPDRESHGHGLNSKAIVKLMTTKKPKLIITCDCATSDVEQVQFINSFKIDVIITDHHEAPEVLPPAIAIINPKAPNAIDEKLSAKEIEHLTSLAGVGVAFKLAQAVLERLNKVEFVYDILPYVTVGTISDVVPLTGENRYFVTKGLQLISAGKHYGLKRLLESAGYTLEQGINSEHIAFGVAPRINASGRLDTTEEALKVLISDNPQEIEMAIVSLNNFNKIRQELCENILLEAEEMYKNQCINSNSIILFKPDWHIGIIGIVASKLVERYYKPAFLMTYSEETKQVRCSSRSIDGVNIHDVLSANAEYFDGFGGHAMAGGMAFSTEKFQFEQVKEALASTVDEILAGVALKPLLNIDLELQPSEVDGNLISDIERLQPFGAANPSPVFALYNLKLTQKLLMGSNRNHLKLFVEDSNHNTFVCVWWSKGDISLNPGDVLDIAFSPQLNTYKGTTTLQLVLQDIHADNLVEDTVESESQNDSVKVYDHRKKTDILASVEDYVKSSDLKIGVFAEDKKVLDKLRAFSALSAKVFGRNNMQKLDSLMFFDYPPTQEIFDEIIKQTEAKSLHFMNYEISRPDEKGVIKTFYGMLKFASNNKDGVVDISRCAAKIAQSNEAVIELLSVFEQCGQIKVIEKSIGEQKIELLEEGNLAKTLHTNAYKEFLSQINSSIEFKEILLDSELNNFCN